MLELEHGRPENMEGRLKKEVRVYDYLDKLHVEYDFVDHEAVENMEACAQIDQVLQAMSCKNLFLCNRKETQFYLLMIPVNKKLNFKELSDQLGTSRLTFAKETYMQEFLDITPGAVSVLGLINDHEKRVQLLVDRQVMDGDYIGCHPCTNTTSLRIREQDMWDVVIPAMQHQPIFVDLA